MALGFAALLVSPVPLIRQLGLTLAVGTLVACALTLLAGPAALALADRGAGDPPRPPAALGRPLRHGRWLLAGACVAALAGIVTAVHAPIAASLGDLAPRGFPELRSVQALQRQTRIGATLRVAIQGPDLTDPAVIGWLSRAQPRVLAAAPGVAPGPNLGDLFGASGPPARRADVVRVLDQLPPSLVRGVISPRHDLLELSLGLPLRAADARSGIVQRVRAALAGAPRGVSVQPAGVVALDVATSSTLRTARLRLTALSAALVALLLLAVRRSVVRALVPLVAPLLVSGLVALGLTAGSVALSPLAAALEPLALAVGVEFGILLEARYAEARRAGLSQTAAEAEARDSVGGAILVSGGAVTLAFATLVVSRFGMLQQLGALAAVEVAACALASILLVPRLAAAAERSRARLAERRGAGRVLAAGPVQGQVPR